MINPKAETKFPLTSYKGVVIYQRIYYSEIYNHYLTQYYAFINGQKRIYSTLSYAKRYIERSILNAERSRSST